MQTQTGRFSKYLTNKPGVSVSRDKKSGLFYAKFTLDKKYTKPTGVRDDGTKETAAKAQKVAEKIRDQVWKDWRDSFASGKNTSPPVSRFVQSDDNVSISYRDRDPRSNGASYPVISGSQSSSKAVVPFVQTLPFKKVDEPNLFELFQRQMDSLAVKRVTSKSLVKVAPKAVEPPKNIEVETVIEQVTISDAIKLFLVDLSLERKKNRGASTLNGIKNILNQFEKKYKFTYTNEITLENLQDFQDWGEKTWTKRSYNNVHVYTRKFLKWAFKKNLTKDWFDDWKFNSKVEYGGRKNDKRAKWSKILFDTILMYYERNDQKILLLSWHTGMDICDVARITEDQITDVREDGYRYIEMIRLKAKDKSDTSKELIQFPIVGEVERLIEWGRMHGKKYLFNPSWEGLDKDYDPTEVTRRLGNKRALIFQSNLDAIKMRVPGAKAIGFKRIRHTFYTNARQRGIPDHVLMKWGGWVDTTMLNKIYDVGGESSQWVKALEKPIIEGKVRRANMA